jgi:hypothetical protein
VRPVLRPVLERALVGVPVLERAAGAYGREVCGDAGTAGARGGDAGTIGPKAEANTCSRARTRGFFDSTFSSASALLAVMRRAVRQS